MELEPMNETLKDVIVALAKKAEAEKQGCEAMHYSQAVLNLANAAAQMQNIEKR
jgi:hypothetical protein